MADEFDGWGVIKTIVKLLAIALGATSAANAAISARVPPLGSTLRGAFNRFPVRAGDIAYVVAGSGPPVLFLHGLGIGNSMQEWERNFDAFREKHTVYAFDFLGWGWADHPAREYFASDYIDQVLSFVENVVRAPCCVIASSDSCAFAVEAAGRRPELFEKLVLICPPVVNDPPTGVSPEGRLLQRLFALPIIGQAVFNFLASRVSIRSFMERQFYFEKGLVTDSRVSRRYIGSHQPHSRYAPASFLVGALRKDARETWSRLPHSALLVWGRNAQINGLDTAPEWLALKPDARLEVIDRAMLLPHVERDAEFNKLVLGWLKS